VCNSVLPSGDNPIAVNEYNSNSNSLSQRRLQFDLMAAKLGGVDKMALGYNFPRVFSSSPLNFHSTNAPNALIYHMG
jgi:hypothetical protein